MKLDRAGSRARSQRQRRGGGVSVSVIMPTTGWSETFERCARRVLDLIDASACRAEFVVVHDGKMSKQPAWLLRPDVRIVGCRAVNGPATARNRAADRARGDVLFFVDADVELAPDALRRVHAAFDADSGLVGLFGAYDDEPAATGAVSQFRNLLHHHTHVAHPGRAGTFWAGCGAVRSAHFQDVGGFDENYDYPSVEDIELGMRIRANGGRILLDPLLQCKHHKNWSLRSMVVTDIGSRAAPWTRLIAKSGRLPVELNIDWKNRISGLLAVAAVIAAVAAVVVPAAWLLAAACAAGVVSLNLDFYLLCLRQRGPAFAALSAALHFLFFVYSSVTFGAVFLFCLASGERKAAKAAAGSNGFASDPSACQEATLRGIAMQEGAG